MRALVTVGNVWIQTVEMCVDRMCFNCVLVDVENVEKRDRVLLHVENDGSLCSAKESKGSRGGEQTQTGIHTEL